MVAFILYTGLSRNVEVDGKDLGHFWLGYIGILGHLQLSAHTPNFERL